MLSHIRRFQKHITFLICFVVPITLFSCDDTPKVIKKEDTKPVISLVGHLNLPVVSFINDVWGYVDPNTNKEYALVGNGGFGLLPAIGLHIIDVSDPSNPIEVARVNSIPGFDVKVWKHYAYTVTGSSSGMGHIVDISDPSNPQIAGTFPSAHNIFITENGYMYLEAPGLRIFNLNSDPLNPEFVWSDQKPIDGHDATVIGNRLYDFHGNTGTHIYDVTDPETPQLLCTIDDPSIRYNHSGWVTKDNQYLFICDEIADHPTPDITIWNINDLTNPTKVSSIIDANAKVHNLYIIDDFAYVSYYTAGFRIFDVSDPTDIKLVDEYDTDPNSEGEFFGGAFGVYPFAPSGNIYVSDFNTGFYIFSINEMSSSNAIID